MPMGRAGRGRLYAAVGAGGAFVLRPPLFPGPRRAEAGRGGSVSLMSAAESPERDDPGGARVGAGGPARVFVEGHKAVGRASIVGMEWYGHAS